MDRQREGEVVMNGRMEGGRVGRREVEWEQSLGRMDAGASRGQEGRMDGQTGKDEEVREGMGRR